MAKDIFPTLENSPFLWCVINAIHHRLFQPGQRKVGVALTLSL